MITVFGSINLDLIGGVDRLPKPGETVPGSSFATSPGGKGANQALAARRAGAEVRLIGATGSDAFADPALALLREAGVNLAGVRTADGPTGIALILVDQAGENVIAVIPGANGTVGESDAGALKFQSDDILLLQLEVPVAAIRAATTRARNAGARVLLNFAPFRSDAIELVELATHLIVNESECALIAKALQIRGDSIPAQATALAKKCQATMIITLGADGVLAIEGGHSIEVPAIPVEAVDTVGAGDTFCGYLAAALGEGLTLAQALSLASRAASLACTRPGAQPAIPLRHEVEAVAR